jgi:DNA gyrase/topoisomerase IV subunit B
MYEYVLIQALTYPKISFKFNGQSVKYTAKKFLELFKSEYILQEADDYFFAIMPNESDDFKHISFVNGLETARGGSHINYIMDNVVSRVRDTLVKKFKTLKPADIKNRLQLVLIAKNLKGAKWDGQTKESITNPLKDMSEYFKDIDFDALAKKLLKNSAIIDPITEVYKLKEELKKRQELKNAEKEVKKPKSEKFMPPIGAWDNLFLAEGDSAANSISKILGRKGNGFFAMFGVPPNAYDSDISVLIKSDKITDLRNILNLKLSTNVQENLNFKNIILTTDFDLPGHFIAGQLLGLFARFAPHLFEEGRIKRFVTPLIIAKDSKENIVAWFYNFDDYRDYEKKSTKKLQYEYKKGLGSWDQSELDYIISQDTLEAMLEVYTLDDVSVDSLNRWLKSENADLRKEMLEGYEFNIMGI